MDEPGKTTAEFDLYSETYSDQINHSLAFSGLAHDFFTRAKADYLNQILCNAQFFKQQEEIKALDVGCGHGLIHPYLLENNKTLNLSGVDVASSVLSMARKNNPNVSYQDYEGLRLPYEDNTFDIAYTICVLHHVDPSQWLTFLQEMKRVVKNKGLVVIFEHNPLNPITRRIVKRCPLDKGAVLLKSSLMKKLVKQAGLINASNTYILFSPIDKPFFQIIDRKLAWLPFGAQYYTLAIKSDT